PVRKKARSLARCIRHDPGGERLAPGRYAITPGPHARKAVVHGERAHGGRPDVVRTSCLVTRRFLGPGKGMIRLNDKFERAAFAWPPTEEVGRVARGASVLFGEDIGIVMAPDAQGAAF